MSEGHTFTFPDRARGELDKALDDLVGRAKQVQSTQGRLRALLKANQSVIEHLDLPVVLERIVEAAVELADARAGGLGVIAADGTLEQFVNVGMTAEQVARARELPDGHSVPSFLSVPVRVRDEVYGTLYVAGRPDDEVSDGDARFSDEDEQLVTALAATAGIAIENARLFAETRRRQGWAAASAEITGALLSTDDVDIMPVLAGKVLALAAADVVWMLQPSADPTTMTVATARGVDEARIQGMTLPLSGSIVASVLEGRQPRQVHQAARGEVLPSDGRQLGPVMAMPLVSAGRARGVLLVARLDGATRFARGDLEMAADFAGQASVAMELSAARSSRQRVALLEDRGRIARDLHDHVIQQLFATGLELQSIVGATDSGLVERIGGSIDHIDASISQIRTVIFALSGTAPETSVRNTVIELANDVAPALARAPAVSFSGPVDLIVTGDLFGDVVAVIREALTNIARHAAARQATISLAVTDGAVEVIVTDDGHGSTTTRRSGLANLEQRALSRGGSFEFESGSTGSRVVWQVPLDAMGLTETASL